MTLAMTRMAGTPRNRNDLGFLTFWKDELEQMSSTQILHWTVDTFYPRLVLKTAFEPEGCVILSLISTMVPKIAVFCNELDYQVQRFWKITDRFYAKTGLEIVPIHSLNQEDFDVILVGARRQVQSGVRVLKMGRSPEIPVISPLIRWRSDALARKLQEDAILDSSFLHAWQPNR